MCGEGEERADLNPPLLNKQHSAMNIKISFPRPLDSKIKEALEELAKEEATKTLYVQDKEGRVTPVADIVKRDECPQELFDNIIKRLSL